MFKRGFKAWSERVSIQYRKEMSLTSEAPLDVFAFAKHLNIIVKTPNDFDLNPDVLRILLKQETDVWSAVTICMNERHMIIYNTSNAPTRRSNDIMHEIAHVVIGHEPQGMHSFDAGIFLRHYDQEKELEADYLAGSLLLPKDALLHIKKKRIPANIAARTYLVSERLLTMRMNLSGANKIYQRTVQKYSLG